MQIVFVYGTLRAGEINDIARAAERFGIAAPRLVGAASMSGRLYDFGRYPGLVPDSSAGSVLGDVYEIEDALVPVLDEIEHVYPGVDGLFQAEQVTVEVGGRAVRCLFYPVRADAVEKCLFIEAGDWVAYRLARDAARETVN